ncbi:Detected protein of unknown function [Hibiscus syriacus]|uniref:Cytochrome P450 78A7-like n=1 Tax=Hibiscus syriacus TaxID=106335 RepID=A0A6A3BN03_HIBSY|nr:Detected protein of unknown function [Hibiscus syriacus]
MVGNSNESTVAEERGREVAPTNKNKKRDQSKARESASLESMVAEFGERLEKVQHDFKSLEDHVLEQVDTLKGNAEETNNEVEARFIRLEDMIQAVRESIEGMREDLTLCKRAAVSEGANNASTPRVKKHADIERGACRLDTLDEFKKELKKHFYPENVQEMHRRDIRTVDEAIAIVESLVDFQPYSHTNAVKNKDKYSARGGGERQENNQGNRDRVHRRPQAKEGYRDRWPHPMSSCPKLGSLSAIIDRQDTESQAEMGSLQVLNALKAKSLTPTPSNGLMYVEAMINEKLTRAMVDTGATHNFVSKDEANRLGLKYTGAQNGSRRSVCILEKGSPCMIPMVEESKEQGRDATELSAIQHGKGIKKGDITYLAMLKEGGSQDRVGTRCQAACPGTYRMAPPELEELRRQLKELVDMGMIRTSKTSYGAPILFQKKYDGSLHMGVNYQELNKVTIKNRYPIPLIANLFDRLGGAKVYTKMDLQKGYYQVRIAEGDEPKTTCITRYRSYEWLVMPFGLTNAPATFCTLMNKLFQPYLDQFMVVYLDDIVVYSNSIGEHADHLRIMFKILRENELYVKKEKCTFATEKVHFLRHVIDHGKLLMDRNKIKAITEWEPPTKVSEMRSFLGLVNYYRRFIQGYSTRASPLTDLLKKGKAWEWSEQCQKAFEDLKAAVSQEPVLALPDFTIPFEVHADVSDFAIGGVLMQEGHPIAFESRKLNDTERCAHFTIKTDNVATSYFQTQKKLSPKQARWQDFLAEFDYTLEYKPGKTNIVADALSRKAELAAISLAKGTVLERIKEGLEQDPMARELVKLASDGKTQQFWVEDGLLYNKGWKIYVPKWDNLRRDLIKECHDTKWAGHPGQKRIMALLKTSYFWPHMKDSVELYVKTCLVCQQDKRSEAIGQSPFELVTGQQPLTPHTLTMPLDEGKSPGAAKMDKSWEENADIARACLEKARKEMKKWADEKRRHREFSVGDLVLYLPSTLKIHPVFHVSMLKPYHADKEDPSRGYSHRTPPVVTKSYDKEVETVLTSRTIRKRRVPPRTEYLIKLKGLPESEATWELAEDLWQFEEHLKAYEATRTTPE